MTKENYINVLLERRSLLLNLINERKEKEFKTEGIFSIRQLRGKIEIFRRIPTKPGNGEYLGKKKRDTAISLAEKDYNSKIIIAAEDEVKHIDEAIEILQGSLNPDSIFGTLPFIQQQLIEESTIDLEYIRKWESVEYEGNPYEIDYPYTTIKGEKVKSKSEKFIADSLFIEGIPYRYEFPFRVKGYVTKYPDFTILNVRTYKEILWEHFGKMDNPDYCEKALNKLDFYYNHGLSQKKNLIITMESSKKPFDPGFWVEKLINEYLK